MFLAEKLLGTDGKHRHGDLAALGEQGLVVGGVLAECPKLLEGIVHRLRPCVQGSKVLRVSSSILLGSPDNSFQKRSR